MEPGPEETNDCPVERVRLTVPITDDPTMPVLTFRTWVLGISSCAILAFLSQFYAYRATGPYISQTPAILLALPVGKLMAATLPTKLIRIPATQWSFSMNPGPFNVKEHALIGIFAVNGAGGVYGLGVLTQVKAFYQRELNPWAALLMIISSQLVGSVITCTVNFATAWWLLSTVENICHPDKLPEGSPWICPEDYAMFSSSIIWGVVGPRRIFGSSGLYSKLNIFFLIGLVAPIPTWALSLAYPEKKWLRLINVPLILGAIGAVPPSRLAFVWTFLAAGLFFNYFVYRRFKGWWARHIYPLSAGLDAGITFFAILNYIALQMKDGVYGISWWGLEIGDHCPLAQCPTAPGIVVDGCPIH